MKPHRTGPLSFLISIICIWFPLATLIFTTATPLFGQSVANLNIEKVQDDGLKNSYIFSIGQDKNGFMWFGTIEGLFRYDGYSFKGFDNVPGGSNFLINKPVLTIYPEDNKLWIGYVGGIAVIDINTQSTKNYSAPGELVINFISRKNDSVYWVGVNSGLFEFNKRTATWRKVPVTDTGWGASSVSDDKNGHLYFITSNSICCFTKSTGKFDIYHPRLPLYPKVPNIVCPNLGRSMIDAGGNIWIATWGGGLLKYDPRTHAIRQWLHKTEDLHLLPFYIAMDILDDKDGNIWLASKEGGVTIFNPQTETFTNYPVEWQNENKIAGAVTRLFRDGSGIIWVGTENGIFKYDPHNTHLSKIDIALKTDTGLVPAHTSPLSMLKDKDGLFWMGMYQGVFVLDQGKNELYNYTKALGLPPNFQVFNILQDPNGSLWLTARNLLVNVKKRETGKTAAFVPEIFSSPDLQSTITTLYIDRENRFWIGTHKNGIFRFDPATKKFTRYNYDEDALRGGIKEIHSFCELSKDSLLVGGLNTGLFLLHTNAGSYEKIDWRKTSGIPAQFSVNGIYKIGQKLWIGTDYNGLLETDTRLKKAVVIGTKDGLPSMDVSYLTTDGQKNLWVLTNSGVVKIQTVNRKITVFDKKDGILNFNELNYLIVANDNTVIIGGEGCLYTLTPSQILKNREAPKVFITSLKIFDKDYTIQKSQPIELNYNQNYFSLEYVALNYTRSKFNRYAYKMDGLDKKWNDAGTRRYVSYANLDEGTYTFNVKACNSEGVWNTLPAKLVLIIKPPYWHRWWFYLSAVVIIASIVYVVYAYNINQLKIRLQMRDKIARDLHDDIGSTLSGINIFSKIALQKMSAQESGGFELF